MQSGKTDGGDLWLPRTNHLGFLGGWLTIFSWGLSWLQIRDGIPVPN